MTSSHRSIKSTTTNQPTNPVNQTKSKRRQREQHHSDDNIPTTDKTLTMFRKTKKGKKAKAVLRNKRKATDDSDDDHGNNNNNNNNNKRLESNDDGNDSTSDLIAEAKRASGSNKKAKTTLSSGRRSNNDDSDNDTTKKDGVMHEYAATAAHTNQRDLSTLSARHHPDEAKYLDEKEKDATNQGVVRGDDGILRNKSRNKFHAGPIRAMTFVRTTSRFDYQPDICKDYKETGFCGFGDTCIYLHDRGNTMTGWELEQQWEAKRKQQQDQAQREIDAFTDATKGGDGGSSAPAIPDDGIPFACFICRNHFTDPVVTSCGHYFCEKCIMNHVRQGGEKGLCPISGKDTNGVFNEPTKLLAKKRKVVGRKGTWKDFAEACQQKKADSDDY